MLFRQCARCAKLYTMATTRLCFSMSNEFNSIDDMHYIGIQCSYDTV